MIVFFTVQVDKVAAGDMVGGSGAGVRGTPSLFVNGRQVKQRSVAGFQRMIDAELRKLKSER